MLLLIGIIIATFVIVMPFDLIHDAVCKLFREHPETVAELSKRLQLSYLEESETEGNVCFVESEKVRPEFRQVFTAADVSRYLGKRLGASCSVEIAKVDFYLQFPYPSGAEVFWGLAST